MHAVKKITAAAALATATASTFVAGDAAAKGGNNVASRMRGIAARRASEEAASAEAEAQNEEAHGRGKGKFANSEEVPRKHVDAKIGRDGEYDDSKPPSQQGQGGELEVEDVEDEHAIAAKQDKKKKKSSGPVIPPREFICPLTKRVMKEPVRAYLPLEEGAKKREYHHYEKEWIKRWIEERGTDPVEGEEVKLTMEDLEDDEEMRDRISAWATRKNYEIKVPAAYPPKDTEFEDTKKDLEARVGSDSDRAVAIMDHFGVEKIEYNSVDSTAEGEKKEGPLITSGVSAGHLKDLVEAAALPALFDKENEDLQDPNDDRQGHEHSLGDLKGIVAYMPRYEQTTGTLGEIMHEDHKGTGKTQRCVYMYEMFNEERGSTLTVSMQGHSSAREWHYDTEKDGDHFVAKGGSKEEPGNMDTPTVGTEEENVNTSHRFEGVEVHSHYWGEYKHLKYNGEFTAQGGRLDAGGLRHTLVEKWKLHRTFHMHRCEADKKKDEPLKVVVTGHGSGGALAQFFVLDSAVDSEKLPLMDKLGPKMNPYGCESIQCLVDNGEIEFTLVTFGSPRVMNDVGRDIVERATYDKNANNVSGSLVSSLRALRVEMIFDPVPHMAGPKREMRDEHVELFKPVGEVFYLAPAFGEGKSMSTAEEFMKFWENEPKKESAVLEVQGLHALDTYSLAVKGGADGNQDFLFKMHDANSRPPFWSLTEAIAKDHAKTFMKWINAHIYDDKDHFGKMMRKMGGGGMFDKMGDMFKGGKNPLGNLGNMFGGGDGSNPLGNLGNMFGGGENGGMPDMSEMMKHLGGKGGMPFDDMMKHDEM